MGWFFTMLKRLQGKFLALLFLGFTFTLAVALGTGTVLLRSIQLQLGTGFGKKQVLYDKERSIHPILQELELTQKLAKSEAITSWAANEQNGAAKAKGLSALEKFRQQTVDKSYFLALMDSQVYYFSDVSSVNSDQPRYRLDPQKPADRWFYNTLEQPKTCTLNVEPNEVLKTTKVWINCLIWVQGVPKGVVGTGFDLGHFIRQVINDSEQGISNFFINTEGSIQAHKDPDWIDYNSIGRGHGKHKSLFDRLDSDKHKQELRRQMDRLQQSPQEVAVMVLEMDQKEYLVGMAYIPEIGWYNVSLLQMGIWADAKIFLPAAGLLVLTMLLLLALSFMMIKGLILDRLAKLEVAVGQVAQGDYSFTSLDRQDDEIGRLTEGFAKMARTIEANTSELERKVRERTKALELANETKDKFFSIISHDLRAPIGSLAVVFNEILTQPSDLDDELYQTIQETTIKTRQLLDDLLNWAQSQSQEIEFHKTHFRLSQPLEDCFGLLGGAAKQKNIQLAKLEPLDQVVSADAALVTLVLRNLLSNSIKFTEPGGRIEVSVEELGEFWQVNIKDTGVGISEETLGKLFKLGEKVNSSLGTHSESGSGLGLILCAEFVAKNGGQIGVESKVGQGTRFWFTLPKGEASELCQGSVQEDREFKTKLAGLKVLVAEDSHLHQETTGQVLKELGLHFKIAETGTEAVALAQDCDLVLMDIDLPLLNGVEATREIRRTLAPGPWVLVLSSYSKRELEEVTEEELFDGYINKPLSKSNLLALLRPLLLPR